MDISRLNARIRHIPVPEHMQRRPITRRGFPVPFFVAWLSPMGADMPDGMGEPDFRVVDGKKLAACRKLGLCWLCGKPLGKFRALVVGPMCLVTRRTPDPDSHTACAEYAARACPFLANDRTRRNEAVPLPEGAQAHPMGAKRNPGVCCVFVHTERWLKLAPQPMGLPPLFQMPSGEPRRLTFWANGERATRRQVMDSLNGGLEILKATAEKFDGAEGVTELACYYAATVALIERWTDDFDSNAVNDDNPPTARNSVPAL